MSRPIPRLTAVALSAAVLITAGWLLFAGGAQVACADLIKPILEAKTAKFKSTVQREGQPALITEKMILGPGQHRSEFPGGLVSIHDFNKKKWVMLNREKKTATVFEFTNSSEDHVQNYFGRMQAHLLAAKEQPNGKSEALGEKEIDGSRAVGYRMSTPGQVTVVWGDPETGLPIRIEFSSDMLPKTKIIMTDFAFNVDLDKSLFSVEVPAGYVVRNASMDQSLPQEKDLLDALRHYSDALDGAFPDALPTNLKALEALYKKVGLKRGKQLDDKQFKEAMRVGAALGRGFVAFPAQLPSEADAHYAGKGVKRDASRVPIFWYRPTKDTAYRIVYADLSVREADTPPSVPNAQPLRGSSDQKLD